MKQNDNVKILKKKLKFKCYKCNATSVVDNVKCNVCKGTGLYSEWFYYVVINNIAYSMDTLK